MGGSGEDAGFSREASWGKPIFQRGYVTGLISQRNKAQHTVLPIHESDIEDRRPTLLRSKLNNLWLMNVYLLFKYVSDRFQKENLSTERRPNPHLY